MEKTEYDHLYQEFKQRYPDSRLEDFITHLIREHIITPQEVMDAIEWKLSKTGNR